jgi:beta-lactamase superfamily II metal-dependent hydrolase
MKNTWKVDTLALVIATHRHKDHIGGMARILKDIPVKNYLGNMEDRPNFSLDDTIQSVIDRKNISILPLGSDTIMIDNVQFIIFPQPPEEVSSENENNNSVIMRLDYGEFSMLFTGDAETKQLDWLLENFPVGVHKKYRHPHKSAVEAYEQATNNRLYCTIRHGTVRIYGYRDNQNTM